MNDLARIDAASMGSAMHDVLINIARADCLTREDFGALAEFMPGAYSIGAASMGMQIGEFRQAMESGVLKPLLVLLSMVAHIEARKAAH